MALGLNPMRDATPDCLHHGEMVIRGLIVNVTIYNSEHQENASVAIPILFKSIAMRRLHPESPLCATAAESGIHSTATKTNT